jgi:hypothetical protein
MGPNELMSIREFFLIFLLLVSQLIMLLWHVSWIIGHLNLWIMKNTFTSIMSLALLIGSLGINAQTLVKMGSYSSDGVPNYLDGTGENISGSLIADLKVLLPDGENLLKQNPALYYGNTTIAINLSQSADVYLAFVAEQADFKSSVGYYTYVGAPPTRASQLKLNLVFPNISGAGSGGNLRQGDRVKLGKFPAGTNIGFFLIANGYRNSIVSVYGNDVFYTDPALNPESNAETKKHSAVLYDQTSKRFVLMFEDFNRMGGSDHDFNDAIFIVSANPSSAFNADQVSEVKEEKEVKIGGTGKPNGGTTGDNSKLTICHYPPGNKTNPQQLVIAANAWPAHKAHGDALGECGSVGSSGGQDGGKPGGGQGGGKPGGDQGGGKPGGGQGGDKPGGDQGGGKPGGGQDGGQSKMITICHYPPGNANNPQDISIPESAWSVHQAHGDTRGSCSGSTDTQQEMITVCHYPPGNPNNPQEISIPKSAWSVHQAHGDVLGPCSGAGSGQGGGPKMITVCHYPPGNANNPQSISIPETAWSVHQAHGDIIGECSTGIPTPPTAPDKTCDMPAADFNKMKGSIKSKSFSDDKMSTLKVAIKNKCVTTDQVKDLLDLFSFESDKMEAAKFLYAYTSDKDNYYTVADVFSFSSSKGELNKFIQSKQ